MKLIVIAAAVALLGAACSQDNASRTPNANGTTAATNQPVSLTGCLQKGDANTYILTELSEPGGGGGVEPANAAKHTYKLSGAKGVNDDDWIALIGTKVKVNGTLTKRGEVGTSGADSTDRTKINEDDFAPVDVNAMEKIGDACAGTPSSMPPK
jgi:hypothetical protein